MTLNNLLLLREARGGVGLWMVPGVVSGIQSVASSLPRAVLLAEPRESHVCGIPAWSTQGGGDRSVSPPGCLQMLSATGLTRS